VALQKRKGNCTYGTRVEDGSSKAASRSSEYCARSDTTRFLAVRRHPETSKMMVCNQRPLHYCATAVLVQLQAVANGQPLTTAALRGDLPAQAQLQAGTGGQVTT
jgi:hypothetical protein